MKTRSIWKLIAAAPLLVVSITAGHAADNDSHHRWVIEDLLGSTTRPFATGHRGYGNNLGKNPDKPIENTIDSVVKAYREGVQIVGLDVVMTKDNIPVMMHDDYLSDKTCVNTLTLAELKQRFKEVDTLKNMLQTARTYSVKKDHDDRPSGLLSLEIKTPAPMCDPADITIPALVANVLKEIKHTKMEEQVLIESFSPEIIAAVKTGAPSLRRMLSLSALQLFSAAQLQAILGVPVTPIDKAPQFGLLWVEIGPIYRLPLYQSPYQYVGALVSQQPRGAVIDKAVLTRMEQGGAGSGMALVAQLHNIGVDTIVYTVNSEREWLFLSALGVDGIYTDNVTMGLALEGR